MTPHPALAHLSHRPWPLPRGDWNWQQAWLDLSFIHYRVAPESIRPLLPRGVRLQQFDGSAWLGLVPFRMSKVGPRVTRGWLNLPDFPELNLRTYVEAEGKPGVCFFSLDAASRIAVFGGRQFFGLPYHHAKMHLKRRGDWVEFASIRRHFPATFRAQYRPIGPALNVAAGSFEHWATARYSFYSLSSEGKLQRVEVHHAPWPLYQAEVQIEEESVLRAAGIEPIDARPICHFSPGVEIISFHAETVHAT